MILYKIGISRDVVNSDIGLLELITRHICTFAWEILQIKWVVVEQVEPKSNCRKELVISQR